MNPWERIDDTDVYDGSQSRPIGSNSFFTTSGGMLKQPDKQEVPSLCGAT